MLQQAIAQRLESTVPLVQSLLEQVAAAQVSG
jgi:hypothetical protein